MNLFRILPVALVSAALVGATGCMTERTHLVARGAAETVSGFSQDDIDYVVGQAVSKLNQYSRRYAGETGARRVVNVKDITVDTLERGATAGMLAEQLGQSLREELTNGGLFIVYNEQIARTIPTAVRPEFVLFGSLQQRNKRRDNGNVYQEFTLLLRLVDASNGLETWQTRIPFQKGVDRYNAM